MFVSCTFQAAGGGNGGASGRGGLGGAGGYGGSAGTNSVGALGQSGHGGPGGNGGRGGDGGTGGPGAGGPSWCVFRAGTVRPPLPNFQAPVFVTGIPGSGGLGQTNNPNAWLNAPAGSWGTIH
jgi:hypothetical protein